MNTDATTGHVKSFAKSTPGPGDEHIKGTLAKLDQEINEWLDGAPAVSVARVTTLLSNGRVLFEATVAKLPPRA